MVFVAARSPDRFRRLARPSAARRAERGAAAAQRIVDRGVGIERDADGEQSGADDVFGLPGEARARIACYGNPKTSTNFPTEIGRTPTARAIAACFTNSGRVAP